MVLADVVLRGGKVLAVDRDFSIAQAVAVQGEHILAVGSDSDVEALIGPQTRVIDLGGRTVVPGLFDSHIHTVMGGPTRSRCRSTRRARSPMCRRPLPRARGDAERRVDPRRQRLA